MASSLFLSIDGLTDPLGGSQILPYLNGLARRNHHIRVIAAEKPERLAANRAEIQALVAAAPLEWTPIRYRNRPPVLSSLLMLNEMHRTAIRLYRQRPYHIVHARGYLPALVGLSLKQRLGVKLLFDMRGFWADERRESGAWPDGHPIYSRLYRWFKAREQDFYRQADAMVSLTHAGKAWIETQASYRQAGSRPITVIPCTADFDHFQPQPPGTREAVRLEAGIPREALVLMYLGSLSPLYCLPDMLRLYAHLRQRHPDAWFWFLTAEPSDLILAEAQRQQLPTDRIRIQYARRAELPRLLSAADASLSFIRPSFSKTASSPTKIGELLAIGIPVTVNSGFGDSDALMQDTRLGTLVHDFSDAELARAAASITPLDPAQQTQRREAARTWYDLQTALDRYDALYRQLAP